jgi:hypothetical protein
MTFITLLFEKFFPVVPAIIGDEHAVDENNVL